MATRSTIAFEDTDGKVYETYCHFDGYPEHVGRVLVEHYQDIEKIKTLMQFGYLRSLGAELHECEKLDRTPCHIFESVDDFELNGSGEEYDYLYRDGVWYLMTDTDTTNYEYTPVEKVLKKAHHNVG